MLARGISSYQNASLTLKDGRSQDAEILLRINAELEAANKDSGNASAMHMALTRNQKVWNEFLVALAEDNHPYPVELRANLISLAIWVNRQTQEVLRNREGIEPLISLNRDIIEGLQAKHANTQDASGQANSTASKSPSTSSAPEKENDLQLQY